MTPDTPRVAGMLPVTDGHAVWMEEWGAEDGVPTLYLHGGPGGTLGQSGYRRFHDLARTRLIALEQRGCGRSVPHAADPAVPLTHQRTARLVDDLERLREHAGVDRWVLNGVSHGSTLALAYAVAHPERVLGVVLVAVTTTSRREVDWITEGVGPIYPEAWDRFAAHAERAGVGYRRGQARLVDAYAALMASPDPAVREAATQEWALWEDTHVSLATGGVRRDPRWEDDAFRHAFVRLTTHYWSHDGFCQPPLLERTERLHGIPAILVHGRHDVSSPLITAWELHRRWPGSELLVADDGHVGASSGELWRAAAVRVRELVSRG